MRRSLFLCVALFLLSCQDPSGSDTGSTHSQVIRNDQTWNRADSPHIVRGLVYVVQGATLTIEAGATVQFAPQSALIFRDGSRLAVMGNASRPITMGNLDPADGPGAWIGVILRSNTTSEMHYVDLSGCGYDVVLDSLPQGCVNLGNPDVPAEAPVLLVDHVTVHDASGGGVMLTDSAAFAPGSAVLSAHHMHGYVATLRAANAASFPLGGTFSANDSNEVRLRGDVLTTSQTWALGIPWTPTGNLLIQGSSNPVLTIPAGSTLHLGGALLVGRDAPGSLSIGADGGAPTTLSSRSATPWPGILFYENAVSGTIANTTLEACGGQGGGCVLLQGRYAGGPAPTATLHDVTILNAAGTGIGLTNRGRLGPGSGNLTITGTNGPPFIVYLSSPGGIPLGQYSGNTQDVIYLIQVDVRQDETFLKHDVPYYIYNFIQVGDQTNHPTLTLEPGVTLISTGAVAITVGATEPGALHAVGTSAEPITFTGDQPHSGSWTGIIIGAHAEASTILDHTIVDNAGAPFPIPGAFHFYVDLGPIIHNSVIRNSSGCGILIVNGLPWATDFTAPALGNSFSNNALGDVCGP
jgi:hypothetical protein